MSRDPRAAAVLLAFAEVLRDEERRADRMAAERAPAGIGVGEAEAAARAWHDARQLAERRAYELDAPAVDGEAPAPSLPATWLLRIVEGVLAERAPSPVAALLAGMSARERAALDAALAAAVYPDPPDLREAAS